MSCRDCGDLGGCDIRASMPMHVELTPAEIRALWESTAPQASTQTAPSISQDSPPAAPAAPASRSRRRGAISTEAERAKTASGVLQATIFERGGRFGFVYTYEGKQRWGGSYTASDGAQAARQRIAEAIVACKPIPGRIELGGTMRGGYRERAAHTPAAAAPEDAPPPDPLPADAIARRNAYVIGAYRFVETVARRLRRRLPAHVEIADLVSAGTIGLIEAASRYDPERHARFEAFAEARIRGAMIDDLRERDTLSRDMRARSHDLRDAARRLEHELGRTPDPSEIADALGIGIDRLYERQRSVNSGSEPRGLIDENGVDLLERTITEQSFEDPSDALERKETKLILLLAIDALPEKYRAVMALLHIQGLMMHEIGDLFGISESRVCQIHAEATEHMRETLPPELADGRAA